MSKYTTLLFDADETLLNFYEAEANAPKLACNRMSIDYREETRCLYSSINDALWKQLEKGLVTRDIIKVRRFEQLAKALGLSVNPNEMAESYGEVLSMQGIILSGADSLCKKLSDNYRMYIVTNGIGYVQRGRLSRSGLLPYFDGVFISEDIGSQKPDITFFNYIFNEIEEKDKSKICIIGDSMSSDILGGINAGIDTCYFSPEIKSGPYSPTYTAKSFEDIIRIFDFEG